MMPTPAAILTSLATIANAWWPLAAAWHVALAALVLRILRMPAPSTRSVSLAVTAPIVSVSALAWWAGNPFNGIVFAVLALSLAVIAWREPRQPFGFAAAPYVWLGAVMTAFGWLYPHFLDERGWTMYLYAAPFGLVPCPTLSVAAGVALMTGGSRARLIALAIAALCYGAIGAFILGVTIDLALIAGGVALVFASRDGRGRPGGTRR